MFIIRCLFLTLILTCFNGLDALATENIASLASHNLFTAELKTSPESFKLAKSTFLPDTYDDLGFSNYDHLDNNYRKNECSAYPLQSCPAHGICEQCPFNRKLYKFSYCEDEYEVSSTGRTCVPGFSCQKFHYEDEVPEDKTCQKTTISGKICYKDCRDACGDEYPLDCTNAMKTGGGITGYTICPACLRESFLNPSNCSKRWCKITGCKEGYKLNSNKTNCIELDDTCPEGYFKECETGTQGDPVETEKGSLCYQCKPNSCEKGYHFDENGKCIPDCGVDHCTECSAPDYCSNCEAGFELVNGKCVCPSGYHEVNGKCEMNCNVDHCTKCSAPDKCSNCEAGFELVNGKCVCPSSYIEVNGKCACPSGYHEVNGKCEMNCNVDHCTECSAPDYCKLCEDGYTPVNGTCQIISDSTTYTTYPYIDNNHKITCDIKDTYPTSTTNAPINFRNIDFNDYWHTDCSDVIGKVETDSKELDYKDIPITTNQKCRIKDDLAGITREVEFKKDLTEGDNKGYFYLKSGNTNYFNKINLNDYYTISTSLRTYYCAPGTSNCNNPAEVFEFLQNINSRPIIKAVSLTTHANGKFISVDLEAAKVEFNNKTILFNTTIKADEIKINGTLWLISSQLQADKIIFGNDAIVITEENLPNKIGIIVDATVLNSQDFIHYIVPMHSGTYNNIKEEERTSTSSSGNLTTTKIQSLLYYGVQQENNSYYYLKRGKNSPKDLGIEPYSTIRGKTKGFTQFEGTAETIYVYAPLQIYGDSDTNITRGWTVGLADPQAIDHGSELILSGYTNNLKIYSSDASTLFDNIIYFTYKPYGTSDWHIYNKGMTVDLFSATGRDKLEKVENNSYSVLWRHDPDFLDSEKEECKTGNTYQGIYNEDRFNIHERLDETCTNIGFAVKCTDWITRDGNGCIGLGDDYNTEYVTSHLDETVETNISDNDYLVIPLPIPAPAEEEGFPDIVCYTYTKKEYTDCGSGNPKIIFTEGGSRADYEDEYEGANIFAGLSAGLDASYIPLEFVLGDNTTLDKACSEILRAYNEAGEEKYELDFSTQDTWYDINFTTIGGESGLSLEEKKRHIDTPQTCGYCRLKEIE